MIEMFNYQMIEMKYNYEMFNYNKIILKIKIKK